MDIKELTARKLFNRLFEEIQHAGEEYEQKSKLYWLLEDKYVINKTSIVADQQLDLNEAQWQMLNRDIHLLKKGHPVQHITNKSEFFGRMFYVDENVLIPRPETEELVDLVIKENKDRGEIKILDIGTGSGCIPIILDLEISGAEVFGSDVSGEALMVAKKNSNDLHAEVKFIYHNIFDKTDDLPKVNILISNPPYVPEFEKEGMQMEVLGYEPHVALFSPSDDPLLFYRRIAEVGKDILLESGNIYFEIHENYGPEVEKTLEDVGYKNIRLIKDIHNKDRIVTGSL